MLRNLRKKKIPSQLVKDLIQTKSLKESALGFSKLSGTFQISKLFWLVIFIGCFIGLCVQTYLRIAYYFQYPVAVDAYNVLDGEVQFPPLMLCTYDTPSIADLWKKTTMPSGDFFDWNCVNPFFSLMTYSNFTVDKIYRAGNMSRLITDIFVNKKTKDIPLNVSFNYIATPFSTCLLLELAGKELNSFAGSSVTVKLHKPDKSLCVKEAPYFASSVPHLKVPSLKYGVTQIGGTKMKLWFGKTKYTFLNSPLKHCVDDETFSKCLSNCFINHLNKILTCRFPFTPLEIDKPPCTDAKEALDEYSKTLNIHGDLDFINDCHCTKKCEELLHHLNAQAFLIDSHKSDLNPCDISSSEPCYTEIQLLFSGNERIEFIERLVFRFSDLMADFGANLGFFLSLSALSLLDNLQTYWKLWELNGKVKRIRIHGRMKMRMMKLSKLILLKIDAENKNSTLIVKRIDWLKILYYSMFIVSILSIFNRIRMYWDEPVNTIVVIEQIDMVRFPDITVCGEDSELGDYRLQRAEETKKDSCKLLPWELVDLLPIEKIWDCLSLENSFIPGIDLFQYYGTPSSNEFEKVTAELPYGKCSTFISLALTKFRGSWSMGNIVLITPAPPEKYCAKSFLQYFITPRGEPIDLIAVNSMPFDAVSGLWIQEKRIQHVNAKSKPCVDNEISFKCVKECFEKKLSMMLAKIKCRIPYMKEVLFPFCNSSKTALLAHHTYIKVYQESKSDTECKCLRRCNETYYHTRVYNPPTLEGFTFFNYLFQTNVIETFVDVLIYPFSVLISDIGSILGLSIGFSLLSFFDNVVEVKDWICGCSKRFKLKVRR